MNNKGQLSGVLYVILAVIGFIALAVPITTSVIDTANLTGVSATIATIIVPLLLMAVVAVIAGLVVGGKR